MPNQSTLYELFDSLKQNGRTFGIMQEGIENAVPKVPTLMLKSNIEFLVNQFPERFWPAAMQQRYERLFNYLSVLSILRKLVYDGEVEKEKAAESGYWNTSQWSDWSKLAKDHNISLQSDAKAKSIATKSFPAGVEIDKTQAKNILQSYSKSPLTLEQKSFVDDICDRINIFYLSNREESYLNLKNRKEVAGFMAKSYLADLAKELEGPYGQAKGFDLNNPRKLKAQVDGERKESRLVTDTFLFPTYERLKNQINKHKVAMASNIAVAQDQDDNDRLSGSQKKPHKLKGDEGLEQVAKQLYSFYYQEALAAEKAKKAKDPKHNIKENIIVANARKKMLDNLKKYSGQDFHKYLQSLFPGVDVSKIDLPYPETEIIDRSDNRPLIQRKKDIELPKKSIQVKQIKNGQVVSTEVENTALTQTTLHKPVELVNIVDSDDLAVDTMETNLLNPSDALGNLYFDPILFERFRKRIEFIKTTKDLTKRADVLLLLKKYGLSPASNPRDIVNVSKRYYYQKAEAGEYYQGSKASASFSLHPTRMSTQSRFLHKGHFPVKFNERIDAILNNGVLIDNKGNTQKTIDYIHGFVDSYLQAKDNDKNILKKLFMNRAKDIVYSLCQLKVLENLDDEGMFIDFGEDPDNTKQYVNKERLQDLLRNELIRYMRQDFFTGSRRKSADFIEQLDEDSDSLSCKVGKRAWQKGVCLFGADIRAIQMAAASAMDKIISSVETATTDEELMERKSLANARARIRFVLERYKDLFKTLLVLYKAIEVQSGTKSEKVLSNAGFNLTEFVKAHAQDDTKTFISNFYSEFNKLKGQLTVSDPKALEKVDLPQEVLNRAGEIIQPRSMQQRFASDIDSEGIAQRLLDKKPIEDDEMDHLVKLYKAEVLENPTDMEKIKNNWESGMSNGNKKKFNAFIGDFESKIQNKIEVDNSDATLIELFRRPVDEPVSNPEKILGWAKNRVKFLNYPKLVTILPYYLKYIFGPEKKAHLNASPRNSAYKKVNRDAVLDVAHAIYDEIVRRGKKGFLISRLKPEIENLLHFLDK